MEALEGLADQGFYAFHFYVCETGFALSWLEPVKSR